MSILSKTPVRFPIPWDAGTVFWLKQGDVIARAEFEAELSGEHRAGQVLPFQINDELAAGVAALLPDDPEAVMRVRTLCLTEMQATENEPMPAEDEAALAELRDLVEQHWPGYRRLIAQQARREQITPVVALRWFCTGWEGVTDSEEHPVDYARGPDGRVSLDALGAIDPFTLRAAGLQAYRMQYGGGREKNSAPRSNAEEGQPTSLSGATSPKAGKSAVRSGRKTR